MTSLLSSLKVIARPQIEAKPPILGKRMRLIEKLDEQQAMAQAMLDGQPYEAFKDKKVKDPETGESKTVRKRKAVRPWYFDDKEHYFFEIKVGLKTLELDKGKAAIDVGKKEDLPAVISTLIKAVEAGELDTQILQLSPAKPSKPPKQAKAADKK
ncbi:hypothetical protein E0Z06_02100 [Rheinheimera sp. D18]|uniref:DUF6641 family protein n=1 Tax=Rheinheimera sp. D18 TaxID=2545632 RepID=UPI001042BD6B|nr:DUF6641 family protein [Rheinheimera sp. D18]QBL08391.1 hypothetical protein E0Z06_02100 [Rheinheimera sp. D18]